MRHPVAPLPNALHEVPLPSASLWLALPLACAALAACDDEPATQVVTVMADMSAPDMTNTGDALPPDMRADPADALVPDAQTPDLCAEQVCAPGYKCDARGECVEVCADVMCDAQSECRDGVCVNLCADITCAEGLSCRLGECLDLCAASACAPTERCEPDTGSCVDRCEGVTCPAALRCSPETGDCVAQCDGVLCGSDEVCDARTGDCVNLCEGVTCAQPLSCDPATGSCVDLCASVSCVSGWVCDMGDCAYDDPCAGVSCPVGTLCDPRDQRCGFFFCSPDQFDSSSMNNLVEDATPLPSGTQRIDDLTVCVFDIDWYELVVPANTSLRVGLRYQPLVGLLNLRLYEQDSVLRAAAEVDAPLGDAFVSVLPERAERKVWVRVASANGQFSQNRYGLSVEQNLPGALCNQDAQCGAGARCERGLCGGLGEVNPDTTPPVTPPADPVTPTDPPVEPPPAPTCMDDAREPNNSFLTASTAVSGQSYAGLICPDDADLFEVTLSAPSEVRATLSYTYSAGDLDLYLLDSTGNPLDTSVGVSDSEEVSALVPAAGSVYLSVFGASAEDVGSYSLNLTVTPSALPADVCVDRFDPNDSIDGARSLSLPAIYESLVVCEPDFYHITLAEGQTIQITTQFVHADGDLDISLFSPSDVSVAVSFGYTDTESITYTVPAGGAGVYTLDVHLFRSEGPQPYSLSALLIP